MRVVHNKLSKPHTSIHLVYSCGSGEPGKSSQCPCAVHEKGEPGKEHGPGKADPWLQEGKVPLPPLSFTIYIRVSSFVRFSVAWDGIL